MAKDPQEWIRELEKRNEGLENAYEEITELMRETGLTLPHVRRWLAQILVPLKRIPEAKHD